MAIARYSPAFDWATTTCFLLFYDKKGTIIFSLSYCEPAHETYERTYYNKLVHMKIDMDIHNLESLYGIQKTTF